MEVNLFPEIDRVSSIGCFPRKEGTLPDSLSLFLSEKWRSCPDGASTSSMPDTFVLAAGTLAFRV